MVEVRRQDDRVQSDLEAVRTQYDDSEAVIPPRLEDRSRSSSAATSLPPGVLKMVKVFVAVSASCSRATRWPAATATRA
jgi:hypothetical protein